VPQFALAVALAACFATLAPAVAGAATGGSISGTVTGADTEAALEGIEVCATVHEAASVPTCATTNATGEYSIAELAPGQYDVEFKLAEGSTLNYQDQFYEGKAKREEAEPVLVNEGVPTPGIDAKLAPGGRVQGLVTEGEGKPVQGIEVCATSVQASGQEVCTLTDVAGEYTIAGLASDEYKVKFSLPLGSELDYAQQYYEGALTRALAKPVAVTAGGEAAKGVNAVLAAGGTIEGTVTDAKSKAPLAGVLVCATSPAVEGEPCAFTEATGRYALKRLAAGGYTVHFIPVEGGTPYLAQFYDGKKLAAEADPVEVTPGAAATGIDAGLVETPAEEPFEEEPGKVVPSEALRPSALLRPAIVGGAVEGQTLSMLRGTWSGAPTTVTDEWGQCDATGAITSCHTVASTPTYTLSAADVGHTIRIREKAVNAFGEGAPLFSPASAVVVAKPPATGVLAATAQGATTVQLKALLGRLLLPRGSNAKIAALLKHHGYSVSFNSLAVGRLSVSWYQVPKGAHLSRAKPVLVASGKVSTKASGVVKLTLKLTAKGRKLLAAATKPLKLTAKGVLAPSGAASLRVTHAFTVKR